MIKSLVYILLSTLLLVQGQQPVPDLKNGHLLHIVNDCGAIPKTSMNVTDKEAHQNTDALIQCFWKASEHVDGIVWIPEGIVIHAQPIFMHNMNNATLQIDGILEAYQNCEDWPIDWTTNNKVDFLNFVNFTNFTLQGSGSIDGLGYQWWLREWQNQNKNGRPNLLSLVETKTAKIKGVKFLNSPKKHLVLYDVDGIDIHDIEINVDILKQRGSLTSDQALQTASGSNMVGDYLLKLTIGLIKHFVMEDPLVEEFFSLFNGKTELSWPVFPYKTDGIDVYGTNVSIKDIKIMNWGDSISVKPSDDTFKVNDQGCSRFIEIKNIVTKFGAGMSIGSVKPSQHSPCVEAVNFQNITQLYPLRAIEIKTKASNEGSSRISNVTFFDFDIVKPLWFVIYIGPLQENANQTLQTECMLYPFGDCPTEPKVQLSAITLEGIHSQGGLALPGVIRCDKQSPCDWFLLSDVSMKGWWQQFDLSFITEYVDGTILSTNVDPHFGMQSHRKYEVFTFDNVLNMLNETVGMYKANESDIQALEDIIGIVIWALGLAVPVVSYGLYSLYLDSASYVFDNFFGFLGKIITQMFLKFIDLVLISIYSFGDLILGVIWFLADAIILMISLPFCPLASNLCPQNVEFPDIGKDMFTFSYMLKEVQKFEQDINDNKK